MHADAEANAALLGHLVVHCGNSFLDAERAVERVDGARELGQDAVAGGVGDAAAMLRDEAIRDIAMGVEQAQRAGLIDVHQAGVAGHIGAEDSSETALDDGARRRFIGVQPFDNSHPNRRSAQRPVRFR